MKKAEVRAFNVRLGAHVCALRQSQGWTQAELARAIGCSQQAVFAYEIGERRISIFVMMRISNVLKMSIQEILSFGEPCNRVPRAHAKAKLSPRTRRQAIKIQGLQKTQQRFVYKIVDTLYTSNGNNSSNNADRAMAA